MPVGGLSVKVDKATKVIAELRRRDALCQPLNSSLNRSDWLYSAAVLAFGSWRGAVEASGFDYDAILVRRLTRQEVLNRLSAAASRDPRIKATDFDARLRSDATHHFGTWGAAVRAADGLLDPKKWTQASVIAAIRAEIANGLPVNSVQMARRNGRLYVAGRRRFGSWAAALEASSMP